MSADQKNDKTAPGAALPKERTKTGQRRPAPKGDAAVNKPAGNATAAQAPKKTGSQRKRGPGAPKVEKAKNVDEYFAKTARKPGRVRNDAVPKSEPAQKPQQRSRSGGGRGRNKPLVRIISLGGLGEIGKNITVYESGEDLFIVDCGMTFPDSDMLGVDIVIPDFTYLEKNRSRIRGIILTHGHEDHIGGLPYLLKQVNMPVYGTRLTLGLLEGKLKERGQLHSAKLHVVKAGDVVKFGCMSVELISVNHSIPDAVGLAITTPAGVIIQTGDFKVDFTPIQSETIDLARFGALGTGGVLALLSDSTNAERPGMAMSERKVGEAFASLMSQAVGKRVIIATFSSNIHRVQQIVDMAAQNNRKVAVLGRSMVNVVGKAMELDYLKVPEGLIVPVEEMNRYPKDKMVLVTTGSQGEPLSALSRMSMSDHRQVQVTKDDFIIISATPIPGNEKYVAKLVSELMRLGAEVIYERMYDVHVSGHACQEELKIMLGLTKPKFFIPVHGEYKQLKKHEGLALQMGVPKENVFISDIGRIIETDGVTMRFGGTVPSGRVFVDGLGVGDVGSVVLRDRKHLGEDGLMVVAITVDKGSGKLVAGPEILSRGFVYVKESEELMQGVRRMVMRTLELAEAQTAKDWDLRGKMRDLISDYLFQQTKRKPMVLPMILEV